MTRVSSLNTAIPFKERCSITSFSYDVVDEKKGIAVRWTTKQCGLPNKYYRIPSAKDRYSLLKIRRNSTKQLKDY